MYCPKCGAPEQRPESYCRSCGTFLPDLDKIEKKEVPAREHLKANSFLSLATAVVSLSLAMALYAVLGFRPDTHWLIYLVSGFLIAITAWQVQTLIRTRMLKSQFERLQPKNQDEEKAADLLRRADTSRLLNNTAPSDAIPNSVTENTTRNLGEKVPVRSTKAKH